MKIHEYNEMMAYLTRPAMAYGGRIGFKDGTQLNNEVLLEYFKKHKGKKYSEIAKILDEAGYITKGGRTVTAEA